MSRIVKTALHSGQLMFLQLKPTCERLSCSMKTRLCCSEAGAGWQDTSSGNTKTKMQVTSPAEGGGAGNPIVSGCKCPTEEDKDRDREKRRQGRQGSNTLVEFYTLD